MSINMKIYFQGFWPWRCLNTSLGKNSEFFLQGIICNLSHSYNFFLLLLLFSETWYHCVVQPDFELKIILLRSSELSLGPQVCATTPSFNIKKITLRSNFPRLFPSLILLFHLVIVICVPKRGGSSFSCLCLVWLLYPYLWGEEYLCGKCPQGN